MDTPVAKNHMWTVEEVWALPADLHHRYEVVDGALLVSPSPSLAHQRVILRLTMLFNQYLVGTRSGEVLMAPLDIVFDTVGMTQPDVMVFGKLSWEEARRDARTRPLPRLVIEVLSPSTALHDRYIKRDRYQRAGVECWIVDLSAQQIERWLPSAVVPEIYSDSIDWARGPAIEPLRLILAELFRDIEGDE